MNQNKNTEPKLDALTAARMLENIFEESEVEPNTVPAEALAGFEDLHRSRFLPHRIALAGIILLWILLPVLFIKPSCEISAGVMNDQNLPVYTVSVTTKLPVNKVTASLDGEPLQVYTKDSRTYAVNPDHNGTMEVKVTAANRQTSVSEVAVKEVDDQSPVLTESRIDESRVFLLVGDDGTGVDFESIYAVGEESGKIILPESVDPGKAVVVFLIPEERYDIFVPDMRGNVLHLSMERQ